MTLHGIELKTSNTAGSISLRSTHGLRPEAKTKKKKYTLRDEK
jgi:hypothetical protein